MAAPKDAFTGSICPLASGQDIYVVSSKDFTNESGIDETPRLRRDGQLLEQKESGERQQNTAEGLESCAWRGWQCIDIS